ncbi:Retinol dehydrogenase 11 [Paragonimus heterotremus]|uniref:Retinol dehydrogenase 11 n=1 Tax=Paragonimus heterotremus TaxID=100268 RepID=A0A8J4WKP2_9TREM|nr:Retinol dehydrogenase 11 [Paragonimus heterotremus]
MTTTSEPRSRSTEVTGWIVKRCIIRKRLDGQIAIVTAASEGVGEAVSAELARRGCRVIMACQTMHTAVEAKQHILKKYGALNPQCKTMDIADGKMRSVLTPVLPEQLQLEHLDLTSVTSVRQFALRISVTVFKLNFLINKFGPIVDGFRIDVVTSCLSNFLLVQLMLPLLKQAESIARIINMRVPFTFWEPSKVQSYCSLPDYGIHYKEQMKIKRQFRMVFMMRTSEMIRQFIGTGVLVVNVNSGLVRKEVVRKSRNWISKVLAVICNPILKSSWTGVQTTMYTALTDELITGGYYSNCKLKRTDESVVEVVARK